MRVVRLLALASLSVFGAACGGGAATPDASTPDAKIPDAIAIDAACPGLTYCPPAANLVAGTCVDTTQDEQNCGGCGIVCMGGQWCDPAGASGMGACECPPAFVPATPTLGLTQLQAFGNNLEVGFGLYSDPNDSMPDGLIVGYDPTTAVTGMDYTLSATPGTPPFIGAGFHVMLNGQTPTADAAAYATAGTITFDTICQGGFSGHAAGLTFSAVDSLTNPTIDPNGCSFTLDTLTFSYGAACQ